MFREPRSSLVQQLCIVPLYGPGTVLGNCGIRCKPEAAPGSGAKSPLVNLCRHLHVSELLKHNKTYDLSFAQKDVTPFLIISVLKLSSLLF